MLPHSNRNHRIRTLQPPGWSTQVLCTQPFESFKCQSLKTYCSGKEAVHQKLRKSEVFRYVLNLAQTLYGRDILFD